ncbi:MAG: helix-turn-helix domain-containing protein [Myxococcota bacterium]
MAGERAIIALMKEIGFTRNEAKAYIGLLKQQPATGYEVAARSGVPRSAIYNVLKKLESSGLANAVHHKPTRYMALPPDQLHTLMKDRFTSRIDALKDALELLAEPVETELLWQIQGYRSVMDKALGLIARSTEMISISLWAREAEVLRDALTEAANRGVKVVAFSLTELPSMPVTRYAYGIAEEELEKHWPHKLILIIDREEALVGHTDLQNARAVLTRESAIVDIAITHMVLDITLYGQRKNVPTSEVIASLQTHMAPIDELMP